MPDYPSQELKHTTAPIAADTTNAENSLAMVMSVWWSFVWRFLALSVAIGVVTGLILGVFIQDLAALELISTVASMIIAIPVSIWSLGSALNRKHHGYHIVFTKQSIQDE